MSRGHFEARIRELIEGHDMLATVIGAMLEARAVLWNEFKRLTPRDAEDCPRRSVRASTQLSRWPTSSRKPKGGGISLTIRRRSYAIGYFRRSGCA